VPWSLGTSPSSTRADSELAPSMNHSLYSSDGPWLSPEPPVLFFYPYCYMLSSKWIYHPSEFHISLNKYVNSITNYLIMFQLGVIAGSFLIPYFLITTRRLYILLTLAFIITEQKDFFIGGKSKWTLSFNSKHLARHRGLHIWMTIISSVITTKRITLRTL
jgi:hypothetical protein